MFVRLIHGNRTYVREPGDRLETDLGVLEIPPNVAVGDELETHLGEVFAVRSLRLPDWFEHFERTGAPMLPRDVGLVLGETGVGGTDRVLDIGTGTGVLAAAMGNAGATVETVERDADAAGVARENMEMAGVESNVTVHTGDGLDILGTIDPVDVITLDTGDAAEITKHAPDVLRPGGMVTAYSPFVEDAREVVEAARETLTEVECVETIQRTLDVDDRGTRPSTKPVGHTGYLTVARRH